MIVFCPPVVAVTGRRFRHASTSTASGGGMCGSWTSATSLPGPLPLCTLRPLPLLLASVVHVHDGATLLLFLLLFLLLLIVRIVQGTFAQIRHGTLLGLVKRGGTVGQRTNSISPWVLGFYVTAFTALQRCIVPLPPPLGIRLYFFSIHHFFFGVPDAFLFSFVPKLLKIVGVHQGDGDTVERHDLVVVVHCFGLW